MIIIPNEKLKKQSKLEFLDLMNQKNVSHIHLFQRIDRARKGYLTHKDIFEFMNENSNLNEVHI